MNIIELGDKFIPVENIILNQISEYVLYKLFFKAVDASCKYGEYTLL